MLPLLETERLLLRPIGPEDIDSLHALWTQPGVRRWLFDDEVIPRARVVTWPASAASATSTSRPSCSSSTASPTSLAGRGLAAEAARAAIRFAFEERAFARVMASADAPNLASIRVLEKAGLRFDKRVTVHGLDTVFYALDRDAWLARYELRWA